MSSKPRIASSSALLTPNAGPTSHWERNPPPPYEPSSVGGATPPSRYQTPMNGLTPSSSAPSDYFSAARRVSAASAASPNTLGSSTPSASAGITSAASIVAGKKKPPPIPMKRIASMQQAQYVTAIYDFEGQSEGDLAFREGDRIKVIKKTDSMDDWWDGEVNGRVGVFPANYVQL